MLPELAGGAYRGKQRVSTGPATTAVANLRERLGTWQPMGAVF